MAMVNKSVNVDLFYLPYMFRMNFERERERERETERERERERESKRATFSVFKNNKISHFQLNKELKRKEEVETFLKSDVRNFYAD